MKNLEGCKNFVDLRENKGVKCIWANHPLIIRQNEAKIDLKKGKYRR